MATRKQNFTEKARTKKVNTGITAGKVMGQMGQGTATKGTQGTASPEEQAERAKAMKTQGRKGCKAVRINMAIQPENYDYIKVMAGVAGQSMTDFVNAVVSQSRVENTDVYEQAKKFTESLKPIKRAE